MNERSPCGSTDRGPAIPWKAAIRLVFASLVMLGVLLLAAGRVDWWEAWAYVAMGLVYLLVSRAILLLKNPELASERAEAAKREGVKSWDRILMPLTAIFGPVVSWVLAGLGERFGWSPDLPRSVQLVALAVILLGNVIGSWAMSANRFFSSCGRIQTDRGHTVVRDGPYRIVRHPGYAGGILSWMAAPFLFSSYVVAIPTVLVICGMVIRTALEDRTLQAELEGYKEYAGTVRYRLLPGVW